MTIHHRENAFVLPTSRAAFVPGSGALDDRKIGLVFVDDDDAFREAATSELQYFGFDVMPLPNGTSAINLFETGYDADAIVLDWNLPGRSGSEVLTQLRRRGVQVPAVFLTGMPELTYEHTALDVGAMDFVDKARGIEILAKRLRLIVESGKRSPELPASPVIAFGHLHLYPRLSRAQWRGQDVGLTVTEFKIVRRLASNAGEHVTYREIYDCVHYDGFIAGYGEAGYHANVRSSVKRIRNKFRAIDPDFAEIENFTSFGYRWRDAPGPDPVD